MLPHGRGVDRVGEAQGRGGGQRGPGGGRVPAPRSALRPAPVPAAAAVGARQAAPLEGVVINHAATRKAARDAAWRATPEATMFRAISGG